MPSVTGMPERVRDHPVEVGLALRDRARSRTAGPRSAGRARYRADRRRGRARCRRSCGRPSTRVSGRLTLTISSSSKPPTLQLEPARRPRSPLRMRGRSRGSRSRSVVASAPPARTQAGRYCAHAPPPRGNTVTSQVARTPRARAASIMSMISSASSGGIGRASGRGARSRAPRPIARPSRAPRGRACGSAARPTRMWVWYGLPRSAATASARPARRSWRTGRGRRSARSRSRARPSSNASRIRSCIRASSAGVGAPAVAAHHGAAHRVVADQRDGVGRDADPIDGLAVAADRRPVPGHVREPEDGLLRDHRGERLGPDRARRRTRTGRRPGS